MKELEWAVAGFSIGEEGRRRRRPLVECFRNKKGFTGSWVRSWIGVFVLVPLCSFTAVISVVYFKSFRSRFYIQKEKTKAFTHFSILDFKSRDLNLEKGRCFIRL
jgi:hypothetical protein